MAGFRIEGNTSANVAEVNSSNELKTALSNVVANIGGVRLQSENDAGTLSGSAYLKSPETSSDYRLRTGLDTLKFSDTFNAVAQNTQLWSYTAATMTMTMPGSGYLQIGTVQGTTSSHGTFLRTFQYFPLYGASAIAVESKLGLFTADLVAGEVFIWGLGLPTGAVTPPTDGVYFKLTSAGLIGELIYNGVATQTGVLPFTPTLAEIDKYQLIVGEDEIEFWVNDNFLGEVEIPSANGQPFMGGSLPAFFHKYNTGSVTNTNTVRVTDITVSIMDIATFQPWAHQLANMSQQGLFGQNGHTQGKTTIWTNNTAPTAAALTNTAAAFTGLGGIVAVLPTLTANNDGKLITYQNPASTINISGKNLCITRIRIDGAVSVILAGGPVIYAFALAVGHTATSLATTETANFVTGTTHAPRILPLGIQSYAATAAVGTTATAVNIDLATPIVVRPGEFLDIVARNIGTVTTTGAITFTISIGSYWE
jgi:hypothetical protein